MFFKKILAKLSKACEKDYYDKAMHLATAANIVRKDMLEMQATFKRSRDEKYQQLTLVVMIHEGASLKAQSNGSGMTQATLSTTQLLQ